MKHQDFHKRVETIFDRAIELEETERAAYLDKACAGDTALRERVERLLAVEARRDGFMEEPTVTEQPAEYADSLVGSTIGNYKLLELIGEGGFGVVYMAEQLRPVTRKVAFKIIKLGMDTKEVIARFEAERQALAFMDHPNIAKVLDAGCNEAGRPYFVMDLVRGIPITAFCDENKLSAAQRLELFCDVCAAVQHAHQKGIIHRDLKPNNVLVTINGDKALPKVIDFGIAKATQGRLTEKTLFTQFRQFIGTPEYMSPEQAQMSAVDVDTRSDIYSLGVLLYELLTGRTPFDTQELLQAGYEEICRRIREEEPPKPSTRLSTMTHAERGTVARLRKAEPDKLGRIIRGELDWIVMKAMEKDRSRRYETANGLALDIRRFLNDEPVTAVAPGVWYTLQKLARRHRGTFATVSVVAASLVLGLGLALFAFASERVARRESDQARRAEAEQRQRAEDNERRALRLQYASDMRLAQRAVQEADLSQAAALLDAHEPQGGKVDLRGWEWRYLKGQLRQEKALVQTHASISKIAFSPDGHLLAAAGRKPDDTLSIDVLDASDFTVLKTLSLPGRWDRDMCCSDVEDPNGWVAEMTFSQDNSTLIVSRNNNQGVLRFDMGSGELERLVPASMRQATPIWPAKLTPDQQWLVGMYEQPNGEGRILRTFELATGSMTANSPPFLVADRHNIDKSMRIAPDGTRVCVSCQDDVLRIFSLHDLAEIAAIKISGQTTVAAWSPDGQVVATGYLYPWSVDLWDAESGHHLDTFDGSLASPVVDICFSPDGGRLAVTDSHGTVMVRNIRRADEVQTFRGHVGWVNSLAFTPDSRTLATGGRDGSVRLWDVGTRPTDLALVSEADTLLNSVYSPDGRYLATTTPNGVVRLFNAESEALLRTFTPDRPEPAQASEQPWGPLAFSPDGRTMAAGNGDHTATVYHVASGEKRLLLEGHTKALIHLRYSPDGKTIATTGEDNGLILWNATSGEMRQALPGPEGPRFIDFSPDPESNLLAYRGKDCFALMHVDSGEVRTVYDTGVIWSVTFSPNGKTLALGLEEEVRLYDVPSLDLAATLTGINGPVPIVAFSPDGHTLAIPTWGGFVHLWNLRVLSNVGRLPLPIDWMVAAQFSPDGNSLVASTLGHGVHQFRAPSLAEIAARGR